jgi:RND family efflux transporter MFP subunit
MKRFWWLLILPLALLLWWGLDRGEAAPEIHFSTVRLATIQSTVLTNGKVEPAQWAAARVETAGVVRSINIQRGQTVQAGQTLISLDTTAAAAELAGALARQQEAQAEIASVQHGGKAAQLADLDGRIATAAAAVESAQRTYDADRRLLQQQAATRFQVQNDSDALERARLQLQALKSQRRALVTSSDLAVAQAKLRDAEAAVASAKRQVGLGAVTAPISGTVYQFDLKVGAYLQPGDQVALIGNIDQMKVTVYVDEPDLGRIGLGMPVKITWDARPGQAWWGKIDKLPTEVVSLETRKVGEVTTMVSNPNHDLLPGVSLNATIISTVQNNAVSIPKAALRTINGVSGVFKLKGSSLEWTPIRTGVSDINNVQVLSGLKLGDKVADRAVEPADAEIKNHMRVKPVFD